MLLLALIEMVSISTRLKAEEHILCTLWLGLSNETEIVPVLGEALRTKYIDLRDRFSKSVESVDEQTFGGVDAQFVKKNTDLKDACSILYDIFKAVSDPEGRRKCIAPMFIDAIRHAKEKGYPAFMCSHRNLTYAEQIRICREHGMGISQNNFFSILNIYIWFEWSASNGECPYKGPFENKGLVEHQRLFATRLLAGVGRVPSIECGTRSTGIINPYAALSCIPLFPFANTNGVRVWRRTGED